MANTSRQLARELARKQRLAETKRVNEERREKQMLTDGVTSRKQEREAELERELESRRKSRMLGLSLSIPALVISLLLLLGWWTWHLRENLKPPITERPFTVAEIAQTEAARVFIHLLLKRYSEGGSDALEEYWVNGLPPFILESSRARLIRIREPRSISIDRIEEDTRVGTLAVYCREERGVPLEFRIARIDGNLRLLGID